MVQGDGSVLSFFQGTGSMLHHIVPVLSVTSPGVQFAGSGVSLLQHTGLVKEARSFAPN